MRVLVLCGDRWHPADTARAGLAPLEDAGFAFEWIEHAGEWTVERMARYPLVVLTKANNVSSTDQTPWISEQNQAVFRSYVDSGNGLLVIHSGAAGYHDLPLLRGVIGGAFTTHPPQCSVSMELREDHSLTASSAPFTVHDEHYMIDLDDGDADLFLTTVSEHGRQPGGWTRSEGRGRVCVLTPGHNLAVWLHPSYQALIGNALRWCGRIEQRPNGDS